MKGPRRFINQLVSGETLDQVFLVRDKDLRTTRNGDLYICCTLADRTGTLPGRMWQASESIYNAMPAGGFIHIRGRTEDYKGNLQVILDACRPYSADKVDLSDYQATTELDVEQMWAELLEILRDVQDASIRLLIKKFVEDRELVAGYKKAPAAVQMHHPFLGGLLEHTLGVARAARAVLPLYPKINADLVLAGVFLHDIGKISELSSATNIEYTERGSLVGHITQSVLWIQAKADEIARETGEPFCERTLNLLQHLMLSHHGVHEYGSPKLPMIPEAFMLHYLDNLDAKMWMCSHLIDADTDEQAPFTSYQRQLETRLYKWSGPAGEQA
jgi:3'-5' exoribonuclease